MSLTILSDEAIAKVINHYWGEDLVAVTELDRDICKAQAELTRKEIGEWLEKALGFDECPSQVVGEITQADIQALKGSKEA